MVKTQQDANDFYELTVQWIPFQGDIETLSAKKPDGAANGFKLKLANQLLSTANRLMEDAYRPIRDFETFDEATVPTYSDVVVVFSQYKAALKRFYSDFTAPGQINGKDCTVWWIDGKRSQIPAHAQYSFS